MLRRVLDREGLVKTNLTKILIESVKELQLKYAAEGIESLKNDESTNALCFCLEAVFIHGLKNPFLKSMSAVLSTGRETQFPEPSFWEFLLIFCHQEVILQINSLRNINTDIGRCRAWVRIALNDGLLISYIQLILTDKRVLKEYYKPTAFLRDPEQCDILKSYLYGIEPYHFQLACNSSLLNTWNSTPLALVGLCIPADVIAQGVDVAENMNAKDLQALPSLKLQSTTPPKNSPHFPYENAFGKGPLLEEDEALRLILSSKGTTPHSSVRSLSQEEGSLNFGQAEGRNDSSSAVISNSMRGTGKDAYPIRKFDVLERNNDSYSVPSSELRSFQETKELDKTVVKDPQMTISEIKSVRVNSNQDLPEEKVVYQSNSSSNAVLGIQVPSKAATPQEESSYAALFQSYGGSDGVIGTPIGSPITIGSFLESCYFQPLTQRQTAISHTASVDSSQEGNHKSDSPSESMNFDFGNSPQEETSSDVSEDSWNSPQKLCSLLETIPNETGLDAQNYRCKQCGRPIGMIYGATRVCGFSGSYFCSECHLNDEYVIPSRILMNWDFTRFSVSVKAKEFLLSISDKPVFNLKAINPKLYNEVEECSELLKLRVQLQSISVYLKTCKSTALQQISEDIWPKEHLYQKLHHYSITDLLNVPNRILFTKLGKLAAFGQSHIKSCGFCKEKGFVCEICRDAEVIFPFDLDSIYKCVDCPAVYHKKCMNDMIPCPRCERWRVKRCDSDNDLNSK